MHASLTSTSGWSSLRRPTRGEETETVMGKSGPRRELLPCESVQIRLIEFQRKGELMV